MSQVMRTVKIPECMNPFYVEVNGHKYSYPAGTTQEVPEEVAVVIEAHEGNHHHRRSGPVHNQSLNIQADWNVNDPGDLRFVKNKPFGEDTEVLFDQTVEFADMGGLVGATGIPFGEALELGKHYEVTFNGSAYPCVAVAVTEEQTALGNLGIAGMEDTGEPFLFLVNKVVSAENVSFEATLVVINAVPSATVKIEKSVVHKLDPKYLPEGAGGGGAQPDWNAAEGEAGHVLNRTHHIEKFTGNVAENGIVNLGGGVYICPTYPVELITGEKYLVTYGDGSWECEAVEMPESGGWMLGNIGAATGGDDTGHPFIVLVSNIINHESYLLFGNIQFMDLSGNDDITNFQISGTYYKRARIGAEWIRYPGIYCRGESESLLATLEYARIKPFLVLNGEFTIRIWGDSSTDGIILRCTEHDSEKIIFENVRIKSGTVEVKTLTIFANESAPSYTTENYTLTSAG